MFLNFLMTITEVYSITITHHMDMGIQYKDHLTISADFSFVSIVMERSLELRENIKNCH